VWSGDVPLESAVRTAALTSSAERVSASSGAVSVARSMARSRSFARASRVTASRSALYPLVASSFTTSTGVERGTGVGFAGRSKSVADGEPSS
jgi:hypothetical protein